jgi:adenine-specific DNA-methyltransferase
VQDVVQALSMEGLVRTPQGELFTVRQGTLAEGRAPHEVWRLSNEDTDSWLRAVEEHMFCNFAAIGKIRVGVKTTADRVFIRSDWANLPSEERPELLRPLITHHIGRRFRARNGRLTRWILYPHTERNGKRSAVDLEEYPSSKRYLEAHRKTLERRQYIRESGRAWFEIWVPQSPKAWAKPKLVFRDICEHPVFWIDLSGAVVNGDCYWLPADAPEAERLLWLAAAVGNSSLIEEFYDRKFNNKLYSRRRRFLTQYVEQFPLPDPNSPVGKAIIGLAREIYDKIDNPDVAAMEEEIDALVWAAFGLTQRSRAAKESAASY